MANSVAFDVSGLRKLGRELGAAGPVVEEAIGQALLEEMQLAFRASQRQVPVRTGVLKNSGKLSRVMRPSESRIRVQIQYGGAAKKYAAKVHNDRSLNHPNGGKAGFAIDPVRARAKVAGKNIRTRIVRKLS